jgi:hypothetical protein
MSRHPEPGQALCDDCGWTTEGLGRFHEASAHREATGHNSVARLSDAPGDDTTGARVDRAFRGFHWGVR